MFFTPDAKVYVQYSTEIMQPFTELLTISKYKNNLLYFKEKTFYYAVECHEASFYGYSYTAAGKVIVTKHKWQLLFANIAEKLKIMKPSKHQRATLSMPVVKLRVSAEAS